MNTATKVGGYLVGLAVVFAAALGIGSAVGPVGPAGDQTQSPASDDTDHGDLDLDMDMDGDAGS